MDGEFIAECFWAGVTEDDLEALDARVGKVLVAESGVRYRGSMLVPQDEVVFCFFDGPSAQAVRSVAERAAIPLARVVASTTSTQLSLQRRPAR